MAVTIDGTTIVTGTSTAATTLTITGKTTTGSNRVGGVSVMWNSQTPVITGATWNGVAMTIALQGTETVDGSLGAAILYIVNPPTGASNIVITWNVAATAVASAWSVQDAHQSSTISASHAGTSTAGGSVITNTVTTASGELIVDAVSLTQFDVNVPSVGANQTSISNQLYASFYFGVSSSQAGADGGVMSWTIGGAGDAAFISIAVSIAAAGGGGITAAQEAGIFAAMNSGGVIGRVDA